MFEKRIKGHHTASLRNKKPTRPIGWEEMKDYLSKTKPEYEEGIMYFHVPYCDKICSFCSLNRSKLDGELEIYTQYLLKEIEEYSKLQYIQGKKFESIYFGGGTPTILKTHQLEQILIAINKGFNISKTCEFSFETTAHNLSLEKLKVMQDLGVNRYSMGVQTFSNKGRKLLNRTGDQEQVIEKIKKIQSAFNGNLCIDIIYNYPDQTLEEVLEDARLAKELKIDSTSFYSLMFHEGSEMSKEVSPDYYELEKDLLLHNTFLESMLQDEYEVLEHTKIVRKNKDQYKYIRLSHKGIDMLPIGVGAGGNLGKYSGFSPKMGMKMFMSADEVDRKFKIFGNLFQYPKVNFEDMKQYICDATFNEIYEFLKELEKNNYLTLTNEEMILTTDGIFWGNTISSKIMEIAVKDYE